MSTAAEQAVALAGRIRHLRDAAMRVQFLRHELAKLDALALADLVTVIVSGAEIRRPEYTELLLGVSLALTSPPLTPLRLRASRIAEARGQLELVWMLRPPPDDEESEVPKVPDFGRGRPLSLGERKSLARTRDRLMITRVVRDPHPDVVRILLENPSLTEEDVVRLASHRPIKGGVLREVFGSVRWIVRYRIRRTLVLNPCCPTDVAVQLGYHLNASDARLVASSPELSKPLREACLRTLESVTVH